MKKVLLSLAAVTAIAAAVPAAAQPYGAYGQTYRYDQSHRVSINEREATLARKIDTSVRRGDLRPYEANRLMAELRQIEVFEHRLRANGLNRWERDQIDVRLDRLSTQVRLAVRDDDRRYGYGYGNQYGARW